MTAFSCTVAWQLRFPSWEASEKEETDPFLRTLMLTHIPALLHFGVLHFKSESSSAPVESCICLFHNEIWINKGPGQRGEPWAEGQQPLYHYHSERWSSNMPGPPQLSVPLLHEAAVSDAGRFAFPCVYLHICRVQAFLTVPSLFFVFHLLSLCPMWKQDLSCLISAMVFLYFLLMSKDEKGI